MRRLNRTPEQNDGITRRWSTDRSTKTTPKWNWQSHKRRHADTQRRTGAQAHRRTGAQAHTRSRSFKREAKDLKDWAYQISMF